MRPDFSTNVLFTLLLTCFASTFANGQNIQITLGPDEIGQNQGWTITVSIQNDRLKSIDNFPDIEGFSKGGQSTSSQTSMINGQISSSQSIIMNYIPTRQGVVNVPAFKMKVNDQVISVAGKKVTVGAPVTQPRQYDPFRSFFERDNTYGAPPTEFIDIKEDAFLALSTNKDEVYVGEGFNAVLAFYVAEDNKAPLYWHQISKQLSEILKKIKPANCWEENFSIENIEGERINVSGKMYTRYKMYQANFYPLNTEPIVFPSVPLEMLKYKVAKNPSFFGQNRQEDFKTFYSKQKTVKVKELPPHPLSKQVAVGDYRLEEKISSTALETGKSFSYDFIIYGEGNVSSIEKPVVKNTPNFDFYEPNVRQNIRRENNRVTGSKTFSYFIIPKEPGEFKLGDDFKWIFFNPTKKVYDTLKAKSAVVVQGESLKNETIESVDAGSFYDQIFDADNSLKTVTDNRLMKVLTNLFIFLMLAGSVYLLFKK
ncbi:MAG: BatD family protein [Cyclobacteriaceae bacterium]|nr:BatD family protein [Cyclobacteriaceae bacterium]